MAIDWIAPSSAAAAFTLHAASSVGSPRLLPSLYEPLSPSQRHDWHGRLVGSVYAIVICSLALPEYLRPGDGLAFDPTFGSSARAHLALSIAAGFFVWDLFFCAASSMGAAFVAHAGVFLSRTHSSHMSHPISPHPTAIAFVACSRIAFPLHAFAAAVSAVPRVFLHLLAAVDATAQLSTASHRMRQDAQPCLCSCQRGIRPHLPRGPLGFRDSRNKSHTCSLLPTRHTADVSHASHAVSSSLSSRIQLSQLVCPHVTPPLCLLSVCSPHSSFWSLLICLLGLWPIRRLLLLVGRLHAHVAGG